MQLHWYFTKVKFFLFGKFMNERREIILYSAINLDEM